MTGTDAAMGSVVPEAPNPDTWPVDVVEIRKVTTQVLVRDAESPADEELRTLTALFEGNIGLLIPEVQKAASRWPETDIPRACALACCGEALARLSNRGISSDPDNQAMRLARSVNALLDHLQSLSGACDTQ